MKIEADTFFGHIYFDSKYHAKCKFALKCIQLVTITNLFPYEVVQKWQHCELCTLRENLNVHRISPTILGAKF